IVDHHENWSGADAVGEKIQQRLRFSIDPVQVFEDEQEGTIEARAMDQALNRFTRAQASDGGIDLVERACRVLYTQQCEQVWHHAFERAVEREQSASDLFALGTFIVLIADAEIVLQQAY